MVNESDCVVVCVEDGIELSVMDGGSQRPLINKEADRERMAQIKQMKEVETHMKAKNDKMVYISFGVICAMTVLLVIIKIIVHDWWLQSSGGLWAPRDPAVKYFDPMYQETKSNIKATGNGFIPENGIIPENYIEFHSKSELKIRYTYTEEGFRKFSDMFDQAWANMEAEKSKETTDSNEDNDHVIRWRFAISKKKT